ncbi:MAG: response regulator [Chloroflexota bacterium]
MINTSWRILIVDDEPDVLTLSKLAMQEFTVFGLPVELHTASSKAEAIEMLNSAFTPVLPTIPSPQLAVAFIDVVMENDAAGLELCDYIRNTMGNKIVQLFIRTGQPGIAPERDVIDRYDINGYFTKAEATEDKLYSLVKSGARQYLSFLVGHTTAFISAQLSAAAGSRESLQAFLERVPMLQRSGSLLLIDNKVIVGGLDLAKANDLAKSLGQQTGEPLGTSGDKFVIDDNNILIKIAGDQAKAELVYVIADDWHYFPPETVKYFFHSFLSSAATLWKQTAASR